MLFKISFSSVPTPGINNEHSLRDVLKTYMNLRENSFATGPDASYIVFISLTESSLWNSSIITHSKDPLENPLTTLPSEELENKALQLFKVKRVVL